MFLTGLLIGLGYALFIGNSIPSNADGLAELIDWPVLVLTFSGILDGVSYSIVIDGKVEMPRLVA